MDQFELVKNRLREDDYFITEPREAVIEYLTKSNSPVAIDDLIEAVETEGINRSSVYRTVNLFEELGVVDKVLFRDGVNRIEMSSEFGGTHHHHLVCQDCERVIEFEECGIENLQRIADIKHGFDVDSHYMEFYGICRECRSAEAEETA